MQVLVVEDDKRISDFLIKGLEENGYLVVLCRTAEEFLESYLGMSWDIIILDVMLPQMDGIQLAQTLRYRKIFTPILMLSALNTVQDKVTALDYGADDYITKPFHFDELLSRIRALTRRKNYQGEIPATEVLLIGSLTIDLKQYTIFRDDQQIELSPKELKLLLYLLKNKDRAVSRVQILNAVWGITFDNQTNVVDVYISYLRTKLEANEEKYIFTVKGIGYMFKTPVK